MNEKFFSIIIVSYNAEKYIADTIKSVLNQDFEDYEIIVKDGLSEDDTLKNIPESDKIKVYSREDSSIYDAMNQAIKLSNGRYICFLNCGEYFKDENVLKKIYETAKNVYEAIVYGDYIRKGIVFKQPGKVTDFYLYRTPLCHQTMFISKELFEKNGLYNTDYKILADYDHTLRDYFSGVKFLHCDIVVCDYLGGGASETEKGIKIKSEERKRVIEKYFSPSQRRKFERRLKLSFKKLRQKMIADSSPKFIRSLYRKIVNIINR